MKSNTKAKTPQRLSGKRLDQAVRKVNAELAQERKISKQKAESRKQKANQPIPAATAHVKPSLRINVPIENLPNLACMHEDLCECGLAVIARTYPCTSHLIIRINGAQYVVSVLDIANAVIAIEEGLAVADPLQSKIKKPLCFHPLSSDTLPEQIGGAQ